MIVEQVLNEGIRSSLQGAAAYNRDDVVPPATILWTDERREWESLVPRLRVVLPQFLTLGAYDRANRVGPAIWLRCVLAGRVPDVTIPPDLMPIIYLPGVSRPTLRATEDCPPELALWPNYNIGARSGRRPTAKTGRLRRSSNPTAAASG